MDAAGDVYVADVGLGQVVEITPSWKATIGTELQYPMAPGSGCNLSFIFPPDDRLDQEFTCADRQFSEQHVDFANDQADRNRELLNNVNQPSHQ